MTLVQRKIVPQCRVESQRQTPPLTPAPLHLPQAAHRRTLQTCLACTPQDDLPFLMFLTPIMHRVVQKMAL